MVSKKCFKQKCELEIKYICKCSDFETYSCDIHFGRHLKLINRTHRFETILSQLCEENNEHLIKVKPKKVKKNALAYQSKDQPKKLIKRSKLQSIPARKSNCLKEETQAYKNLKAEQDSRVLDLPIDAIEDVSSKCKLINNRKSKKAKSEALDEEIDLNTKKPTLLDFQLSPDNSKKWNIRFNKKRANKIPLKNLKYQDLNDKISMLWNEGNNPEAEQDFRRICSFYKSGNSISDPALKKAYQDYISAYRKITSIYHFLFYLNSAKLHIYDTESETEEIKELNTSELLYDSTCITQLPNGELFCYGNIMATGTTLIIDRNFNIRRLPNGVGCIYSSAIYFNRNIYCFGGNKGANFDLSARFDLDKNQWFKLSKLPEADYYCHSVIFNGNIVISGKENSQLLIYSVNIDSFSQVPYLFAKTRKFLISTDRLYLIEFEYNYIYESKIGDEYAWKKIGNSKLSIIGLRQYCTYNKGRMHWIEYYHIRHWKFDLNKKAMKRGLWKNK